MILDDFTYLSISKVKKWRLRHPERVRESWRKTNKKRAEALKLWQFNNPAKMKQYQIKYREKHRDPERRFDRSGPRPEWQRRAISVKLKGRVKPPGFGAKVSARMKVNNPSKQSKVREKIRRTILRQLSDPSIRREYINRLPLDVRGNKNPFYGRVHSTEVKALISKRNTGVLCLQKNPNWRGGVSFEPYTKEFNSRRKAEVKNRDGNCCKLCGSLGSRLHVHHINYNKMHSDINNLVTLCSRCHGRTQYNRSSWETKLYALVGV